MPNYRAQTTAGSTRAASRASRESRELVCEFCGRPFSKSEHLQRHIRSHTGSRPFECNECKKRFARMDTLSRHLRSHRSATGEPAAGVAEAEPSAPENIQELRPGNSELSSISVQIDSSYVDSDISTVVNDVHMLDRMMLPTAPGFQWDNTNDLLSVLIGYDPINVQAPVNYPNSRTNDERRASAHALPFQRSQEDEGSTDRGHRAMQHVKQAVGDLAIELAKEVEAKAISSDYVDSCLTLFMSRFIPAIPVIHSPTYSPQHCDHALLLSMIVLGSVFIGEEQSAAKGEALWSLGHAAIANSWERILKKGDPNDVASRVQLLVTSFLSVTYAMLSGIRKLRSLSHTSLGMGMRWARQAGMFTEASEPCPWKGVSAHTPRERLEVIWKGWVAEEVQRRALLGHYILDGLLTNFSGQPTVVRHTANPLLLPCRDSLFEAKTAMEWLAEARQGVECRTTFRDVYAAIFDSQSPVEDLPLTSLSIRVVLEAMQSLIYEHHEAGGRAIGTPSRAFIGHALIQLQYHHISRLPTMQERVEHEIRWHVICIRLAVETAGLAKQICDMHGLSQDLHEYEAHSGLAADFSGWLDTADARRALLHALALASRMSELQVGRVQCVHLSMAIYTAATIFAVGIVSTIQQKRKPTIAVPHVEDWNHVWGDQEARSRRSRSDVAEFISGLGMETSSNSKRVNFFDELNGMFLMMEQLRPYWGVTTQMSVIIKQWLTIPTLPTESTT